MEITKGLVEQHIHGAFGIDFMTSDVKEILMASELLAQKGVCAYFPTVMTDDIEVIKDRIAVIKEAQKQQISKSAQIAGIHLEGPFINPEKSGIHEKKYILPLDIELYKKIDDDIIKIVTLAPELDLTGEFIKYLTSRKVKLSLGHSLGADLKGMSQVTHLYNAMGSFATRGKSSVVSALIADDIYTEIIADSVHVSDEVLKITFRQKPIEKILLISDALPLAHSDKKEHIFAGQKIFNNNGKLINADGTIAGSSSLLADTVKNLSDKNILSFKKAIQAASENQLIYHKLNNNMKVYWSEDNTIKKTEFI